MIFGNWRPVGMFMGSVLFGYTQALPFREGTTSVHALLLLVTAILVAVALVQLLQGGPCPGRDLGRVRRAVPGVVPHHDDRGP